MFSRAAKSVVKSFGSRRIHIGEKNFKIALIDGAGDINQTLSQLLRNSAKLNTLALYDVTAVNKPLSNFYNEQPIPSEMLTKAKKSCSDEGSCSNAVRETENSNHQGNDGRNQIEKLVEALYRLPIAEEVPAFNNPLIPIEDLMPKLQEENLTVRLGESGKIGEGIKKLKLGHMEAFLKSLPKSIFGTSELDLNRWNRKVCSMNMLNSEFICTRDFSSFRIKPRNSLLRHKALGWTREESRKHFLKRLFMTNCKLPLSNKSALAMSVCYSTLSPPSCLRSVKSHSVTKNFLPSLPHYQELVNLLRSVLHPKSVEKSLFSKICREKCLQSLGRPESSRSSASSSKYLKHSQYLLKRELTTRTSQSSCPHSLSQELSKSIQKASKRFPRSQRNKTPVYRGPSHPMFLRRIHWRGFHNSLFPLAKSDSNKPSGCKNMDKICKPTVEKKKIEDECGRPCKKKSDVCHEEKVKCDKSQQSKQEVKQKPKIEKKNVDSACQKTCLPIGKCELPHTVPPLKMEYARMTCPPPKFVKPKPCPPTLKDFQKDDTSSIEVKQASARKKQICTPPPLPKPPYAHIVLCPCPPPRKVHPGPCPCYETKEITKRRSTKIQPCPLKKKYPCPTGIHYCLPQKKPCNTEKQESRCEDRKKKAPSS